MPKTLYSLFGATLGVAGVFAAGEYSASLFSNLALTWYARDAGPSRARRAIILDLFIYDAIGFIVTVLNVLGWAIVAVYLFFTLGYGYFWFANKAED